MDAAPAAPEIEKAERQITRAPLVLNRRNFSWLTERISGVIEQPAPRWWWVAFTITSSAATFGVFCLGYLISTGVGTWGNNIPVGWAWGITNFVFWIGIGHAGTLISAILFLLRQKWRTSIDRSVGSDDALCRHLRGIFPGVHVGRVWMAWYLGAGPKQLGYLAKLPQPADVGRFCSFNIFHGLSFVLVYRFGSGLGDLARPCNHKNQEVPFWNLRPWLARLESALASLRNGVSAFGRAVDPARSLGSQRCIFRFRYIDLAHVAHHHLPSGTLWPAQSLAASRWC